MLGSEYMGEWARVTPRDLSPRGPLVGSSWVYGSNVTMGTQNSPSRSLQGLHPSQSPALQPVNPHSYGFSSGLQAAKVPGSRSPQPLSYATGLHLENERYAGQGHASRLKAVRDQSEPMMEHEVMERMSGAVTWLEQIMTTCVEAVRQKESVKSQRLQSMCTDSLIMSSQVRRYKHRTESLERQLSSPAEKRFSRVLQQSNWNKDKAEEVCLENAKLIQELQSAKRQVENTRYKMSELEASRSRLEAENDQLCCLIQELDAKATTSISKLQSDIGRKDEEISRLNQQIQELKEFTKAAYSNGDISQVRQELEVMKLREMTIMQHFSELKELRTEMELLKRHGVVSTSTGGPLMSQSSMPGAMQSSRTDVIGETVPGAIGVNGGPVMGIRGFGESPTGASAQGMFAPTNRPQAHAARTFQMPSLQQQIRATPSAYETNQLDNSSPPRPAQRVSPESPIGEAAEIEASFLTSNQNSGVDSEQVDQLRKRAMALLSFANTYPDLLGLDQASTKSKSDIMSPKNGDITSPRTQTSTADSDNQYQLKADLVFGPESEEDYNDVSEPKVSRVGVHVEQRRPSQEDIKAFVEQSRERKIDTMWEEFLQRQQLDRLPSESSVMSQQTASSTDPSNYPFVDLNSPPRHSDTHPLDRLQSLPREMERQKHDMNRTEGSAASVKRENSAISARIDPEAALDILNRHPSLAPNRQNESDGSNLSSPKQENHVPTTSEPFSHAKALLANLDLHRRASAAVQRVPDPGSPSGSQKLPGGTFSRAATSAANAPNLVTPRNVGFLNVSRNAAYSSRDNSEGPSLYSSREDMEELRQRVATKKGSALKKIAALFSFKQRKPVNMNEDLRVQPLTQEGLDNAAERLTEEGLGSPDNPVSHAEAPPTPRTAIPRDKLQQNMKDLQSFWEERTSSVVSPNDAATFALTPPNSSSPSALPSVDTFCFSTLPPTREGVGEEEEEQGTGQQILTITGVEQSLNMSAVFDRSFQLPSTIVEKENEDFTPSAEDTPNFSYSQPHASPADMTVHENDEESEHNHFTSSQSEQEKLQSASPPALLQEQFLQMMQGIGGPAAQVEAGKERESQDSEHRPVSPWHIVNTMPTNGGSEGIWEPVKEYQEISSSDLYGSLAKSDRSAQSSQRSSRSSKKSRYRPELYDGKTYQA